MKNLCFFSRSELTYLYGSLHKYLKNKYNLIHIAYDNEDAKLLKESFGIEHPIIFKKEMEKIAHEDISKITLEEIDNFILQNTDGNFNANGALAANRTSQFLSYEQNITLLKTYYLVWNSTFSQNKIDCFIHEPVALLMTQIAHCFCKKVKAIYATHIRLIGENKNSFDFSIVDGAMGTPFSLEKEYHSITKKDIDENKDRIDNFIKNIRQDNASFFSKMKVNGGISLKQYLFLKFKLYCIKAKRFILPKSFDPIVDNVDMFIYKDNLLQKRVQNLKKYKQITFDDLDTSKEYYYYPIHIEPEAVVIYWGNNKYSHQIKLIENIAAQLPSNQFLYVKEHPLFFGYRDVQDYIRLKAIPNIKLLKTNISGKEIIHYSKGVITINGTSGFEALMLNKQVITFGNSFYKISKRVHFLDNVFELKELLYSLKEVSYEDDDELYHFTLAYLKNLLPGFTDFYSNMHQKLHINLDENAKTVADSLDKWITFITNE